MTHLDILQIIGASALLAVLPVSVWGYVFYRKRHESRFQLMVTFIIGALAVSPILLYRWLWKFFPSINVLDWAQRFNNDLIGLSGFMLIPLSVIITFMFVGVIEEVMKQSVVHSVDGNVIRSIDDAILFSIVAALGFSFTENIIYFHNIWTAKGPSALFVPFVFRSVFSTFAHILFSGIFGYYYGVAHFSKPILQEELRDKRNFIWRAFHRVFHFKTADIFHQEKMFEGLAIAVLLHAVYNVFLEMNWTFVMVPYLVFGYMLLSRLLRLKENQKEYDLLLVGEKNHTHIPKTAEFISHICKFKQCNPVTLEDVPDV